MPTRSATAAAAAAGSAAPAAAAPAAEPAGGTRRGSNNPPRANSATNAAEAVDWDTAEPVDVETKVDDLEVFTTMGVAQTKVVDAAKVWFAGPKKNFMRMTDMEVALAGQQLALAFPPPVGEKDFGAAMGSLQASASARGAVSTVAYRRKVALGEVARALLEEAVGQEVAVALASRAAEKSAARTVAAAAAGEKGGGADGGGGSDDEIGGPNAPVDGTAPVGASARRAAFVDEDRKAFRDMMATPFKDPEVCARVVYTAGLHTHFPSLQCSVRSLLFYLSFLKFLDTQILMGVFMLRREAVLVDWLLS